MPQKPSKSKKLLPIDKRWPGRPCMRVKFWRVSAGKIIGTIEVEKALSEDMADFLLYLSCNPSAVTDELLDRVIAEIKQKRSDHEFHHP